MAGMERKPANGMRLTDGEQAALAAAHLGGVQRTFSDGWRVYETMLANDYLGHREVYAAVRAWLLANVDGPISVLELGCGDASQTARLLEGLTVTSYTGVDLSELALAAAPAHLAALGCRVELRSGELLSYLCEHDELADIVFASFAVHHLLEDGKRAFLREAARHLRPAGALLYVDVFRRDGESRTDYLTRYRAMVESRWTALGADGRAFILDHIETSDFPSSERELRSWAAALGFSSVKRLFRGVGDTERAFALTHARASA
jgi:ubiquinone/menaquinone biosynthesis C-methylase UbiE